MDPIFNSEYNKAYMMAYMVGLAEDTNKKAKDEYENWERGYINTVLRARETGADMPVKMYPPPAVHAVAGEDGYPNLVWGPDRVCPAVEDPPPAAALPQGKVGALMPGTNPPLYRGMTGDNTPAGTAALAPDGRVVYCARNPWGCWWTTVPPMK